MDNDIRPLEKQFDGRFASGLGALNVLGHLSGGCQQIVLRALGLTIELRVRSGMIEHLELQMRTRLPLGNSSLDGRTVLAMSHFSGTAACEVLYDHALGGFLLAPVVVEVTAAPPAPATRGLMSLQALVWELQRHHEQGQKAAGV
jgi:hypothetical protein